MGQCVFQPPGRRSTTRKRKGMAVSAIEYLVLGTEQFLRELPDDEFDALVARCRPPAPGQSGPVDRPYGRTGS